MANSIKAMIEISQARPPSRNLVSPSGKGPSSAKSFQAMKQQRGFISNGANWFWNIMPSKIAEESVDSILLYRYESWHDSNNPEDWVWLYLEQVDAKGQGAIHQSFSSTIVQSQQIHNQEPTFLCQHLAPGDSISYHWHFVSRETFFYLVPSASLAFVLVCRSPPDATSGRAESRGWNSTLDVGDKGSRIGGNSKP
ncbi:hypothetical protein BDZ45DRAFT_747044 [Acephala macrosclerotiorum]|nr:hypothetical protein BDZ45DRAFT_747044 [Acephala macrosclerotiorum]